MSNKLIQSDNTLSFKDKLRRVVAVSTLGVFGLSACVVTDKDSSSVAPKDLNDLSLAVNSGIIGALLIGDNPCPEGGEVLTDPEFFVQDYETITASDENAKSYLFALEPEVKYTWQTAGKQWTAYCGTDAGTNGARFDGGAIIFENDATIIALDSMAGK